LARILQIKTFASLARTRLDAAARSPTDPAPADTAADALDLTFWNSVKDSNRRDELQAYLEELFRVLEVPRSRP
jgi:hypothetical protein